MKAAQGEGVVCSLQLQFYQWEKDNGICQNMGELLCHSSKCRGSSQRGVVSVRWGDGLTLGRVSNMVSTGTFTALISSFPTFWNASSTAHLGESFLISVT